MTTRKMTHAAVPGQLLGQRAVNRATSARQMLLERHALGAVAAIERLVGMQAQAPEALYVGLWSRLARFRADELAALIAGRQAVRGTLLRPIIQPILARSFAGSPFGRRLVGLDLAPVLALARTIVEERPRTRAEFAPLLRERWPERDGNDLAYAVSYLLPTVQVPPRGLWRAGGLVALATIESWLGIPLGMLWGELCSCCSLSGLSDDCLAGCYGLAYWFVRRASAGETRPACQAATASAPSVPTVAMAMVTRIWSQGTL